MKEMLLLAVSGCFVSSLGIKVGSFIFLGNDF